MTLRSTGTISSEAPQLREYEALVAQPGPLPAGFRTSIRGLDLDDAKRRLEEVHGQGNVLSVWNEEDAGKPRLPYARKIVLYTPRGLSGRVEDVARQFIADGVAFVGCIGLDCEAVEDLIDWVAIECGSPEKNFVLTSAHPGESLKEAIEFALSLSEEYEGEVQVVEL